MKPIFYLMCLVLIFFAAEAAPQNQNQDQINEALRKYEEAKKASRDFIASPRFTGSVREAAAGGDAVSQWSLGVQYESGQGIPQNSIKAYVWYSVAAAQGGDIWELASSARDAIGAKLAPSDLVKAQALAEKCFESNYQDCE